MTDQVTTKNFLSPLNFKFTLKRAPHVNFFIQKINIPDISLPSIDTGNPLINIPYPGEHLRYGELEISFKIDEDLNNYMELHGWIRSLGKQSFGEYKALASKALTTGESIRSDITLTVLTSNRNANYSVKFRDAFPINLSSINFDTTQQDVDYIQASATFKYISYDMEKVI